MPSKQQKLSPAEFEVLKILWSLETATVADVLAQYPREGAPAYTTVMTLLGRLAEKGAARIAKDQRPFRYRPALHRATVLRRKLEDFIKTAYDGDAELLLRHLIDDAYLTTEQVTQGVADVSEEL